jgi:hypothetical protein
VQADWWFSLAPSNDIFQPIPGKGARRRFSWLSRKVIALPESQALKGLSATWLGYLPACREPVLTQTGIKDFLD